MTSVLVMYIVLVMTCHDLSCMTVTCHACHELSCLSWAVMLSWHDSYLSWAVMSWQVYTCHVVMFRESCHAWQRDNSWQVHLSCMTVTCHVSCMTAFLKHDDMTGVHLSWHDSSWQVTVMPWQHDSSWQAWQVTVMHDKHVTSTRLPSRLCHA